MPRSTLLRLVGFFLLIAALALATAASAQCPQSTASCIGKDYQDVVIFDDTKTSDAPAAAASYGRLSTASYDRVARTVQVEANVYLDEAYRHLSRATAVDRFELHGAGSAWVTFRLVLTEYYAGWDDGRQTWVRGSARLASATQTATAYGTELIAPFIEISVYVVQGEPIEITYETTAEAWGNEPFLRVRGHLEFIGLPAGAELTHCVSPPLAVEARSWGAVKALYR